MLLLSLCGCREAPDAAGPAEATFEDAQAIGIASPFLEAVTRELVGTDYGPGGS